VVLPPVRRKETWYFIEGRELFRIGLTSMPHLEQNPSVVCLRKTILLSPCPKSSHFRQTKTYQL